MAKFLQVECYIAGTGGLPEAAGKVISSNLAEPVKIFGATGI
jgi:hypothetical protein